MVCKIGCKTVVYSGDYMHWRVYNVVVTVIHGRGFAEFFFFQAEDGIRDLTVTGVQTCALPIFPERVVRLVQEMRRLHPGLRRDASDAQARSAQLGLLLDARDLDAELTGANCCGVAAGASPEDCDVDIHGGDRSVRKDHPGGGGRSFTRPTGAGLPWSHEVAHPFVLRTLRRIRYAPAALIGRQPVAQPGALLLDSRRRAAQRHLDVVPGPEPRPGNDPVDENRRLADHDVAEAAAIGVPDQQVVVARQEPHRCGCLRVGPWRVG